MTSLGARGKCVITLGRVYQSHAVQAVIAITEWALFPLALELEVSYNHVLFIEEYFMLTTANWKLDRHLDGRLDPTKVTNRTSSTA